MFRQAITRGWMLGLLGLSLAAAAIGAGGCTTKGPAKQVTAPATTQPSTTATAPTTRPAPLGVEEALREIERLRALQAAGAHAQVVQEAGDLLERLPERMAPTAWEIPFNRHLVNLVWLGERYGYFFVSRFGVTREDRPDLPVPKEAAAEARGDFEVEFASVTCVDLSNGRKLWSRAAPFIASSIDPRDDALWMWPPVPQSSGRPVAIRLDPVTGEETRAIPLLPLKYDDLARQDQHRLEGLREAGISMWRRWRSEEPRRDVGFEFDLETGEMIAHARPPGALSWNRLAFLRAARTPPDRTDISVLLQPIAPEAKPIWSHPTGGAVEGQPIWLGGTQPSARDATSDAIVTTGSAVLRLDAADGSQVWRAALPERAAEPTLGPMYYHGWPLVAETGGYVTAVSGRNTVFLLDPASGEIKASYGAPAGLLEQPRIVDGQLVVATVEGMLGVSMEYVMSDEEPAWARIGHLRTRSLLAMMKPEQAFDEARAMTLKAPHLPLPWKALAEAAELHGDGLVRAEAPVLWARYMAEARLPSLPVLEHRIGLLRRIHTGTVNQTLVPTADGMLLAVTPWEVLTIDPAALQIVARDALPETVAFLSLEGNTLYGQTSAGKKIAIRQFAHPPPVPEDDSLRSSSRRQSQARVPAGGVVIENLTVAPVEGGGVILTLDGEITRHPPLLEGIGEWRLERIGDRLIGWGQGGVFALDEQYRPAARLVTIEAPADVDYQFDEDVHTVHRVAGDGRTLCVLAGPKHKRTMQLWTADGRKLREVRVPGPRESNVVGLVRLGDGYLHYGRALVWIPDDPRGRIWSFQRDLSVLVTGRGYRPGETVVFGPPRVLGDQMFVPAEGSLYVFSVEHITGG